jgi:hypothetical protein
MSGYLSLRVSHPVPSLNRLFAIGFRRRHREKKATQEAVRLALSESGWKASAPGSSTPTTSA